VVGASTAGWGTADVGGAWQHRFNGNADAAASATADGARGRVTVMTTTGLKALVSSVGPVVTDADVRVTGRADRTSGAYLMLLARVVDANRFYAAQVNLNSNSFSIRKNVNNVWTTLGSGPIPPTPFAADTDYTLRFQVQGTALRAKWWPAGQAEPGAWAVQVTDASFASGQSGVAGVVTTSATTVAFTFDDFVAYPVIGGANGASSVPTVTGASVVEGGSALVGSSLTGLSEL
jgi:hypothetical protein